MDELNFEKMEMVTLSMKSVGEMIAKKRKTLGMNQSELAHYAGTSQPAICYLEAGSFPLRNSNAFAGICRAICDDGTIFAAWIIAYLKLAFFSEKDIKTAIEHMKKDMQAGPMHMEKKNEERL